MNGFSSIRSLLRNNDFGFIGRTSLSGLYHPGSSNMTSMYPCIDTNYSNANANNNICCDERRLGGIRTATKKAGGSSTNGRDSVGRRLGIKVWPNRFASTFVTL
jgi:Ribosomal L27 protein